MQSRISIVEDIVRSYPALLEKRYALQCRITERNRHNPTESSAIASLSNEDEARLKAIDATIRQTYRIYGDGALRMQFIQTVYWHKKPTATLEHISSQTRQEWKNDFLQNVVQQLGLSNCKGCVYWTPAYIGHVKICQYCYKTGKLRVREGDQCFSKRLTDGL